MGTAGHGDWTWNLGLDMRTGDVQTGHGDWTRELDMGTGHGDWTWGWGLDMGAGHGDLT